MERVRKECQSKTKAERQECNSQTRCCVYDLFEDENYAEKKDHQSRSIANQPNHLKHIKVRLTAF